MLGIEHLGVFIGAGLLLNMAPGPDTMYILGRALAQGRRAGIASALGIGAGSAAHTIAAAFGLSAILAASAAAFTIVKLAGAAYLIWLGLKMLLDRSGTLAGPDGAFPVENGWTIFRQAVITNVLNPKVALFFLAFLPQFVSPASESKTLAILFLGGVFILNGTLYCLVLAHCASLLTKRFQRNAGAALALKRGIGGVFVGLGFKLAAEK